MTKSRTGASNRRSYQGGNHKPARPPLTLCLLPTYLALPFVNLHLGEGFHLLKEAFLCVLYIGGVSLHVAEVGFAQGVNGLGGAEERLLQAEGSVQVFVTVGLHLVLREETAKQNIHALHTRFLIALVSPLAAGTEAKSAVNRARRGGRNTTHPRRWRR